MSQYIAIEGAIGAGKTTLAKRLATDLQANLTLEPVSNVPFIKQFYSQHKNNAFTTQLSFFIQRFEQMESIADNNLFKKDMLIDYIWEKDLLFAQHTLNEKEFELYQSINEKLQLTLKKPDLVVYLQAPLEVLIQRIEKRSRDYEKNISYRYLEGLYQKYTEFFCHYQDSPLLIINTGSIDWVNNQEDYKVLKEHILSKPVGRNFLNFDSQQLF